MSDKRKHNRCDVLVTYCWNRVGYNILRSLSARGLAVWCADTSRHNICSMSRFCAGSFTYPDPFTDEEEFISRLLMKVEELRPTVLLPTHDEGIVIARNRHRFPSWLVIPVESEEKLVALSNKRTATALAAEAGVPVPRVYSSIDEVSEFPVVFKTSVGNSANGVFFPSTPAELGALARRHADTDTLIEEWIPGGDVCVDCVRHGSFFRASVYRALVTKTDGGGTTTQREIVSMPGLVEHARAFLDHVDYNGVCGLDFRVDPTTGRAAFIEMNARYTGGLATPITAGFDIPHIHYCLATAGTYDGDAGAIVGTRTKWILGDVITLAGRVLKFKFDRAEWRRACSFAGFDSFDDFRRDDPAAIIGEMAYYLSKLIRNRKLNP